MARLQQQPLTPRQLDVYRVIEESIRTNGFSPTYQEIANKLKLGSLGSVHDHMTALERKGYIRRESGTARAYSLVGRVQGDALRLFGLARELVEAYDGGRKIDTIIARMREEIA